MSMGGGRLKEEEQKQEESQTGRQTLSPCDRSFKATLKGREDLREKEFQKERDCRVSERKEGQEPKDDELAV